MGLKLVGLGPGGEDQLTPHARTHLNDSDVIMGYDRYVDQVKAFLNEEAKTKAYDLGEEINRANDAIERALHGENVSLVSSGDIGIYAMASPVLEMLEDREESSLDLEIIPGITALSASAARLGAPVAQDFAVVSLSDLLTPMDRILKRVRHAAEGDFVIAFYNPRSANREDHLERALDCIREERGGATPVGIVRNAYRSDEVVSLTTLEAVRVGDVDMFSTVIVGNSRTRTYGGWMYTPRGYEEVNS